MREIKKRKVILMNKDENIVELMDEQGDSIFFEHLMTLTYEEQDYIILATLDDNDSNEELEVVILRVEVDDDGNDVYVGIEDRDELDKIFSAYDEILNSSLYE